MGRCGHEFRIHATRARACVGINGETCPHPPICPQLALTIGLKIPCQHVAVRAYRMLPSIPPDDPEPLSDLAAIAPIPKTPLKSGPGKQGFPRHSERWIIHTENSCFRYGAMPVSPIETE